MAAIVVQLGLAMMPLGVCRAASGLTSETTSGTSGSIRQADELSMTTAPAAAALGAGGRFPVSDEARLFLMVGICGGYTTFSAFSLQTLTLLQNGEVLPAAGNIGLSVILCLIGVWLGYAAGMAINAR